MNSRIEELKTMPYSEYLETPEWGEERAKALQQAGYRCQVCNSANSLHVHHRTYENRGDEKLEDLTVLCDDCHMLYHHKESIDYSRILPIQESLDQLYDLVEYCHSLEKRPGIPAGLADIDNCLGGGLQSGNLVVIAGRTGMGKSALAVTLLMTAASHNANCLFFCLEMNHLQLAQRMLAFQTGIPAVEIQQGHIPEDKWELFANTTSDLANLPITIDDTPGLTARQIRHRSVEHKSEHNLHLVFVDYIQLMGYDAPGQGRYQLGYETSKALKNLARELDVPVVVTSQVSHSAETRHDKRPVLSDLREFGSIEADADVVLLIYRDEVYYPDTEFPGVAEINLAKNRNGPTGRCSVYFKKELQAFVDLEVKREKLEY